VVRDLLSERDLPAGAHRFGALTLLVPPTDAVMLQVDPPPGIPRRVSPFSIAPPDTVRLIGDAGCR
jgi:hypothetical protein